MGPPVNPLIAAVLFALCAGAPEAASGFRDVAAASGFDFIQTSAASGEKYPIETMAGGCGLIDFDGDGDLDLYAVNGAPLPGFDPGDEPPLNRLYRNDTGTGSWRFTDVTAASGAGDPGYGMGCATGDYDNDGDVDLYVTNYGPNTLYRNDGGRFTNVTEESGTGDAGWGTSAAFVDIDADGDLDLYVANYVAFDLEGNLYCTLRNVGVPAYCHPDVYPGQADVLYRNNGDGTFSDVTREAGVYFPAGKGLGVVCTDVEGDGDVDIYVANDSMENYLFLNDGTGVFEEAGLMSGTAFNGAGHSEAGMGVDAGDVDGDGRLDLLVGHLEAETNTLYRNAGYGTFMDWTSAAGMSGPSLRYVTFGLAFLDADNDGHLDAFVANGHVLDNIELASETVRYRQPNQFYRNDATGRFTDASEAWGIGRIRERASRGLAAGDLDNDGRVDLIIGTVDDAYELLRNVGSPEGDAHWILMELEGAARGPSSGGSNRSAIGAHVTVIAGGRRQVREVRSAYSYQSAGDLRVHFGLGNNASIDTVKVRWPGGGVDVHQNVPTNRVLVIREGGGQLD